MRFLGLLDSLLSGGISADGLEHLSGDILAHALGDTLGHVGGHILEDGSSGDTVLGGHLGGGVGDVGGGEEELGVGLSLPLAIVAMGDHMLDVSACGLLVSGDVLADNNGFGGAVRLSMASLADNDGLGDDLAEGDVVDEGGSVGKPVSKEELRVGVSFGRGGSEGSGGQEGETKGNLEEGVLRNYS